MRLSGIKIYTYRKKRRNNINYDEIAKYIEKVVFDAKGMEFTQEEAAEIAKTVNLYMFYNVEKDEYNVV